MNSVLIDDIRKNHLLVKQLTYEYRQSDSLLQKKSSGAVAKALSPAYYTKLVSEIKQLDQLVSTLSSFVQTNFKLEVRVNETGSINYDLIKVVFIRNFDRVYRDGQLKPMSELVNQLQNILPFAEYMHDVHLYSYKFKLCNCEVHATITLEDIEDIFERPFVAPRALQQWHEAMRSFDDYARNHYTCSRYFPVVEGELVEEGALYSLTQREVLGGN
ncbi:hypothetical protein LAV72_18185 [Lysinibacillus xylanilyticus]|uniref:hypothetical protein n=1 Tax=Lysinibacillus xylanilyticus TaxID=582475 RepID=UPI002B23F1F1|nr:hypothetical protein [Lysinibacillus xylanilyticus]MEB2301537.1 hypothetical protein [Lysinibacillus xylanilyticus]